MENAFLAPPVPSKSKKEVPSMDAILEEAIRRAREALDHEASFEEVAKAAPGFMEAAERHLTGLPEVPPTSSKE